MNVTYTLDGEPHSFELARADDLPGICRDIQEHLETAHPALAGKPDLVVRVTDGVLNSLADNNDTINLEEVAA